MSSVIKAPEPCKVVSRVKFICVMFRKFKGVVVHVWFAGAVIHTCEVAIKIQLVGVVIHVDPKFLVCRESDQSSGCLSTKCTVKSSQLAALGRSMVALRSL